MSEDSKIEYIENQVKTLVPPCSQSNAVNVIPMNLADFVGTFNIIGGNIFVWSAGVSPDGIFSFSSSGETPALHTYSFEVPQYFGLYILKNTISYMIDQA